MYSSLILGEAAHVVVRLHAVLALQDVGVDRALGQESDALKLPRLLFEDADELGSDDLPLGLGVADTGKPVQEAVDSIHIHQVGVHLMSEDLHHLLRLTLPQQAVVDMHAHQVPAYGTDQQRGDHGGVDSSRKRQKHLAVAHLLPYPGDLLVDEGCRQLLVDDPLHCLGSLVVIAHLSVFSYVLSGTGVQESSVLPV